MPEAVEAPRTLPAPQGRVRALATVDARVVAAVAIAAAYLTTRLLLTWRFPPFFDEAWYAQWIHEVDSGQSGAFVSFEIGKEPLVLWLGWLWTQLGVEPLTSVRLVSVGAGFVTMVSVGLLGRELGGDRVGLVAAALYVVLPFTLVHDVIGIADPLVIAGISSALYLQVRIARRPRLDLALLMGVAIAAALLTKESGKLALVMLPLTLACFPWSAPGRSRRLAAWLGCAAAAVAVAAAGYLVMRLSGDWDVLVDARNDPLRYPVRTIGTILDDPIAPIRENWPVFGGPLLEYLTLPLLLASAIGLVLALRERRPLALVLLAGVALPLAAALLAATLPFPRHVLYVVPCFLVLAAFGVVRAARAVAAPGTGRGGRVALALSALLLLLPAVLFDAHVIADPTTARYPGKDDEQYVAGWAAGTGWEPLAEELERRAGDREAVIVHSTGYSDVLGLLLAGRDYSLVPSTSPRSAGADFLVENTGNPFPDPKFAALTPGFRVVFEYRRARGDSTLRLHERR